VKLHDLHHVLTEYGTSWTGEAEISAWELASGCRDYAAAWVLNGLGLLMGLVIAPKRVAHAFLLGRRTGNLYGREVNDALLDERIGVLREQLLLNRAA
jgi:ubiquinone biosynthesis protein Coq4